MSTSYTDRPSTWSQPNQLRGCQSTMVHAAAASRRVKRGHRPRTWISGAATASAIMLTATLLALPQAQANDVNVPPSMCVAPFLDQAFPMRWHEHFLMNPSTGTRTWVICPLTFDNDVVTWEDPISIRVTGAISSDSSLADVPQCFFTVADRLNLNQPPYVMGPARTYQQGLGTVTNNPIPQIWQATSNTSIAAMRAAIGTDPGISNGAAINDWSSTVFCRLPPGYSLSQIAVFQ